MSEVQTILLQLDTDIQPSSFDAVVAVDAGVSRLLQYGGVRPETVTPLVHGAMFTRSPSKLKHTAIFVGGSDIELAQRNFDQIVSTFFGPVSVSVVMDANGCNTTSVAAVASALQGLKQVGLDDAVGGTRSQALVLGGTGPVGRRIARLVADAGFAVRLHSRSLEKAGQVTDLLNGEIPGHPITPTAESGAGLLDEVKNSILVFNASAAGVEALGQVPMESVAQCPGVLVDLNAVPPAGFFGVAAHDCARTLGQRLVYGALAVGAEKMKLHRAVIQACFRRNDQRFNLHEIADLNREIQQESSETNEARAKN